MMNPGNISVPMLKLSPSVSITFGLVTLTLLMFMALDMGLGVVPNDEQNTINLREKVSINLALQLGSLLRTEDKKELLQVMNAVQERDDDILSIAIRHISGELMAQSGFHTKYWVPPPENQSTLNHVRVPLLVEDRQWASLEISFLAQGDGSYVEVLKKPAIALPLSLILGGSVFYYLYLRRALQHLDPTKVVPDRVSTALDTLAESVMIIDTRGRIMLVNESFKRLHRDATQVSIGQAVEDLVWLNAGFDGSEGETPWGQVLRTKEGVARQSIKIPKGFNGDRELRVNASPVFDGYDKLRGCMVSMQDVTDLLDAVSQIQLQNKKLHQLAHYDQLTGLFNRHAFFERGGQYFDDHKESQKPLACVMCDIDKFKRINDDYGHSAGDDAIQVVTGFLKDMVRASDIVGRYGGEEFCVVLPGATQEIAERVAERFRRRIEAEAGKGVPSVPGLIITSSFGIAVMNPEAETLADLIDQADQALYHSKENGRNRVTVFTPDTAREKE
jgi:diguanylate cyclase (GGDEF)-like protein